MIQKNKNRLPNIIFIVIDTTRAQNISCYGYDKTTMPFLDRFAGNSILYQNAISVAPWTLPAHASFFTGTFPVKHRTYAYAAGANWGGGNVLPAKFKTLAELLQELVYESEPSEEMASKMFNLSMAKKSSMIWLLIRANPVILSEPRRRSLPNSDNIERHGNTNTEKKKRRFH